MSMSAQKEPAPANLRIRDGSGKAVIEPLKADRLVLGRSAKCELSYPQGLGLSRTHVLISRKGTSWQVEDLGSLNGTFLNGKELSKPTELRVGDLIVAGKVSIEVIGDAATPFEDQASPVTFFEPPERARAPITESTSLPEVNRTASLRSSRHVQLLLRAGRELALHRRLEDLFDVIMGLAMEAVSAHRGVLMTLENSGDLKARASRGEGFAISRTVRDRVLIDKSSLLVRDTRLDATLIKQQSIRQQKVRSLIAVPLQTNNRVIGLLYVDVQDLVEAFTREDLELLTVFANVAAIRIEHARLVEVEIAERAAAMELDQAAAIQRGLLPSAPPQIQGLDIAGITLACHTVGGDYFDYLPFADGRLAVLVGDVAGKGMPAALLVATVQAHVRALFDSGDQIAQKVKRLNKAAGAAFPDNRFVTLFVMVTVPSTGLLSYVNAGHNPPILVRASGDFEELKEGGIVLGVFPDSIYEEATAVMEKGDVLVIYSDGVTEAMNPAGESFDVDRLTQLVVLQRKEPATEIMNAIRSNVSRFAGQVLTDDITIVVVRKL
jgi:serine phosphatase RsbU (regulator of sigma subunit)/pSer/pThr/pTyr-binding forkhead associated (FHA) protein